MFCPNCGNELHEVLCGVCGYDLSLDYLRLPTLFPAAAPASRPSLEEERQQSMYETARTVENTAAAEAGYTAAALLYEQLGTPGWRDSAERARYCREKAQELEQRERQAVPPPAPQPDPAAPPSQPRVSQPGPASRPQPPAPDPLRDPSAGKGKKKGILLAAVLLAVLAVIGLFAGKAIRPADSGSPPASSGQSGGETTKDKVDKAAEAAAQAVQSAASAIPDLSLTVIPGRLIVATEAQYPPLESVDPSLTGQDRYVGYEMSLARYIAAELGLSLEIRDMAFDSLYAALDTGEADMVLAGIAYTRERAESCSLSDPYSFGEIGTEETEFVILMKKDSDALTQRVNEILARAKDAGLFEAWVRQDSEVMSHAEFLAAGLNTEVVIETYVQAAQAWQDNTVSVYAQSPDGAYFLYGMACSEADYAKLVPGAKIRVTGYKSEWAGEVEIIDASFSLESGSYLAEAADITALLGTDELILHQNEFVAFRGMTVAPILDGDGKEAAFLYQWNGAGREGDDLYFNVSLNGKTYTFTVESCLCDQDSDVYKAVKALKIGDRVDLEGFLYWYEGMNPHITVVSPAA